MKKKDPQYRDIQWHPFPYATVWNSENRFTKGQKHDHVAIIIASFPIGRAAVNATLGSCWNADWPLSLNGRSVLRLPCIESRILLQSSRTWASCVRQKRVHQRHPWPVFVFNRCTRELGRLVRSKTSIPREVFDHQNRGNRVNKSDQRGAIRYTTIRKESV